MKNALPAEELPAEPEPEGLEVVVAEEDDALGDVFHRSEPSAVDTHCHLFLMDQDAGDAVLAANVAGVGRLICVGIDAESSRRSLELAESFRGVFATAGVHPHTASEFDRAAGTAIEELLGHPMVVAVGETGLDYYRMLSPREDQHRVFRTHIALARETDRPLVVHVRDAWDDALAILGQEGAERVVLHCFSGDEEVAREAAARGYYLSFAGNLTYRQNGHLRRAAAAVDEDRLLAETDSPFLAPRQVRGLPNAPGNVLSVIGELAEIRGVNIDHMVVRTTATAVQAIPLLR